LFHLALFPVYFQEPLIASFKRLFNSTGLEAFFRRISSALLSSDTSGDSSSRS
jgi:hypothetical protein